jgi:hypothetical protein
MKRDRIETLKHNAKLDLRLPDQLKDEFLKRCRAEGVSSGAVIRSLILDYVTAQPRRVPAMAARLKETIMKRAKWIAGGVGGSVLASLAAMSFVFAPMANAEDVKVDFELRLGDGGGDLTISNSYLTKFGEPLMIIPESANGEITHAVVLDVRACTEADRETATGCEVVFEVEVMEVLAYEHNERGGITIIEKRVLSTPVLMGALGRPALVEVGYEPGHRVMLNMRADALDS